MNAQEFDALVIKFTDEVRDTLVSKATEYVPSGQEEISRFHNFEISAAFNQQHSTEALWGFLTKHLVSLGDMVKKDSRAQPMEVWDEKLGDAMAYLILLKGIVTENDQKQESRDLDARILAHKAIQVTQAEIRDAQKK